MDPAVEHGVVLSDDARLASIEANLTQQAHRIRTLEKMLDTRATPLWRRVVFRVQGWPSWTTVAARPAWRPWHPWTRRGLACSSPPRWWR